MKSIGVKWNVALKKISDIKNGKAKHGWSQVATVPTKKTTMVGSSNAFNPYVEPLKETKALPEKIRLQWKSEESKPPSHPADRLYSNHLSLGFKPTFEVSYEQKNQFKLKFGTIFVALIYYGCTHFKSFDV